MKERWDCAIQQRSKLSVIKQIVETSFQRVFNAHINEVKIWKRTKTDRIQG